MVIVSDTSIITNLNQIGSIELLNQLFGEIVIPFAVFEELSKVEKNFDLVSSSPWIIVKKVERSELLEKLIGKIDPGEAESIALAIEMKADLLLIDERKGRLIAEDLGIRITGLLGILIEAKEHGFVQSIKPLLDHLIYEIGFRIHPKLYQKVLELVDEN